MTKAEAREMAERLSRHLGLLPTVTRILPASIDPPDDNDDGWDVLVTVTVAEED